MKRSISTAIALTLGLAVSAAVVVTVFAQKNQPPAASSGANANRTRESAATATEQRQDKAAAERNAAPAPVAPPQTRSSGDPSSGDDNSRGFRTGSLSITATEETNPRTVKEDKLPEIEVDSSNIREIPKSSVQPIRESKRELTITSNLPDSALAAKLADPDAETVRVWRPAFATQGFRGARLDAFAVSQDGSVFAIAERTGSLNGPNGARIILVNTSDWQVLRIFTTELALKKLAFVPGRAALAAVAFPQPALKQNFGLAVFDLAGENALTFTELPFPFNENIVPEQVALLPTGNGVFCSGFFGNKVFFVPHSAPADGAARYRTIETVAPSSALAVTPDGKSFAAVSRKAIEYFNINPADAAKRQSVTTLDLGWTPVDLHFLGGALTDFIVCPAYREDSAPVIIRSSAREALDGRSAGFAVPMEEGRQIGVAFKVKGRIDVVDPASLEATDSVILEQLRPATAGDTAFVFYLDPIHAFCVVDSNGNFFAVGRREGEKRWMKRIIWNGAGKR